MSDNIPEISASSTTPSIQHKKSRQKHDKFKLPTPPPDPTDSTTTSEPSEKDKDFFEYLELLHKSINPAYVRSTSTFARVIGTDEAFDHLEKLYKLMEQMLELREQNAKLHRRIRDLEHLNNIEKMHKQLEIAGVHRDCPELDKDTAFAETILESILSDTKKDIKPKPPASAAPSRLRPSILRRQRQRSGSATTEKTVTLDEEQVHKDVYVGGRLNKPAKVSKWTKVKAAFKWEKAFNSVVDNKSQDSGFGCSGGGGGMAPINMEIARYLRVPSTSDDAGHSPADSGAAGISTPGSLSTTSSNEDFHNRSDLRTPCEDLRSSEDEHIYIPHSKDEPGTSKGNHKYPLRTPWAKMKDMLQTRNSFKKKQRLSAQSDDIQIDVELCSDNEEVFEEDLNKTKESLTSPSCPLPPNYSCTYIRVNSNEIPSDVIVRYQQALAEDDDKANDADSRKISKWTRVKKAFLTGDQLQFCTNPSESKELSQVQNIEEEIQNNYKQLQKKLSLEFQEKLNEWERLKQSSPGTSNPSSSCGYLDESHDASFMKKLEEWQKIKTQQPICKNKSPIQMTREYDLPADFKKKLQEWEKIKKSSAKETSTSSKKKIGDFPRWKSLSGHRSDTSSPHNTESNIEYPVLSEEFRKKLEEWKQMKASNTGDSMDEGQQRQRLKEKTPSPKLSRKNSSPKHSSKKPKDHGKELHWFEKELNKIEKEKQRLERERQKFLEREERLSKLRRSVMGGNKKEVLIHTPSGFYRFEGISRKFTQKLYEWEKAQGIGPEASTFALLSSSYIPEYKTGAKRSTSSISPPLIRSKSADSIAISALNLTCPLMSQQPSSLSLNDVEDLEKECMADSKSSSIQYLLHSHETSDVDEPEALIVEVEDYEEETAAPLETFIRREQLPIYQQEEFRNMCEGETVAAPKIRRSESARAQTNYNLIEDIFDILKMLSENEFEIISLCNQEYCKIDNSKLKEHYEKQKQHSRKVIKKLLQLQEANLFVASSISKNRSDGYSSSGNIMELLDAVQDLSIEILQMAENMDKKIEKRHNNQKDVQDFSNISLNFILETLNAIRSKMLELRRHLSYICASSDLTAPCRKKLSNKKKFIYKTTSNESRKSSLKYTIEGPRYIKAEHKLNQSQGAVKKKIKYRQKSLQGRNTPDTDDEEEEEENKTINSEQRRNKPKKLIRARSVSESNVDEKPVEEKKISIKSIGTNLLQKFYVPTESNYVLPKHLANDPPADSPVTLFVKTTRKLFTPIGESNVLLVSDESTANKTIRKPAATAVAEECLTVEGVPTETVVESIIHLPPLPASPVPQRKLLRDVSPSIKIMMAKYNQKLSEQESNNCKSAGSSGSGSPIAWRSPNTERRVKAQTERYQDVLSKLSPLLGGRRQVQKSASVGYLHTGNKQVTVPIRRESVQADLATTVNPNILKSSSVSAICRDHQMRNDKSQLQQHSKLQVMSFKDKASLTLKMPDQETQKYLHSPEIRLKKLQKAKEEFLRFTPTSAPPPVNDVDTEPLKYPARNRLSQISVDSESSYDSSAFTGALMKSASAGMINIDPDTYKQFDPEIHGGGYVSLPRSTKSPKDAGGGFLGGRFAISNITSKFRKVKMRRGKDRDVSKMNVVSTLCRQSLVVDINPPDVKEACGGFNRESGHVLPSSSKSGTWITKPKRLFKK